MPHHCLNILHSRLQCFKCCMCYSCPQDNHLPPILSRHWWRNVQNNNLTVWHGKETSVLEKKVTRVKNFSCSLSLTHRGLGSLNGANNMPEWWGIRALQGREEKQGDWCFIQANCSGLRLPDTGGALRTNLSHIRSRAGRVKSNRTLWLSSVATQLALVWLICLWYAALLHSITWTAISWGSHSSCC